MKRLDSASDKKWKKQMHKEAGKYLKAARLNAGIQVQEIAGLVKCKPQFICNIENGRAFPPPLAMKTMIRAYGISEDEFLEMIMALQLNYYRSLYFGQRKRKTA